MQNEAIVALNIIHYTVVIVWECHTKLLGAVRKVIDEVYFYFNFYRKQTTTNSYFTKLSIISFYLSRLLIYNVDGTINLYKSLLKKLLSN